MLRDNLLLTGVYRLIYPFYRCYNYTGPMQLFWAAESRGAYDPELVFFYNRIPKVANSSIVKGLIELRKNDQGAYKDSYTTPSRMSKNEVDDLKSAYKFVFVRNPYTRLLSAYLDKVVRRRYLSPNGKVYSKSLCDGYEEIPSFPEFVDYLSKGGLCKNAHWAPQAELLLLPVEMFDKIGRFENLQEDFDEVSMAIAGKKLDLGFAGPPKSGSQGKLKEFYSDQVAETVFDLYKKDFEMFDYSCDWRQA